MERLPSFQSCFFCGSRNPSGLRIAYYHDADRDRIVGSVEPDATLCGYPGVLHGGIQSALLDDVLYWAVSYRFATTSVTLSLTTRFLAPARLGRRYVLEARVAGASGRKVTAVGDLLDAEGVTVAQGEGLYLLHEPEVFREQMLPLFDFSGCSEAMRLRFVGA